MKSVLRPLIVLPAALLFTANLLAAGAAESIAVEGAYARAVPPGQPNSAVFMVLKNSGDQDLALVSAESPASDVVELHTHTMDEGMMKMRKVDQIDLPAGETVTLEPGGLHVMLIGLKEQLVPGAEVTVTLGFGDGTSAELTAPVKAIKPAMADHHH
jgi:copper(I)-binding protein